MKNNYNVNEILMFISKAILAVVIGILIAAATARYVACGIVAMGYYAECFVDGLKGLFNIVMYMIENIRI